MHSDAFYELFGRLVRRKRQQKEWTQEALAAEVYPNSNGDQKGDVSKVELARVHSTEPTIKRYCDALGITEAELQELDDPKYFQPPRDEFPFKFFGNLTLPVTSIFGDPSCPYSVADFVVDFKDELFHESDRFPPDLRPGATNLENLYLEALQEPSRLSANQLPRLDTFTQEGEGQDDERGRVILKLSKTDFLHYCATNRSLTRMAFQKDGRLANVREMLAPEPLELSNSLLGNTYSVHTAIISVNDEQEPKAQLALLKRKADAFIYPGYFQSSAGYGSLAHTMEDGVPNPFATAVKESKDEIAGSLDIEPGKVKITGLCMSWEDLDLNFCAYYVTNQTAKELMNSPVRDGYEGLRSFVPWDPQSVINHIVQNKWEPVGAYNVLMTLIAYFGHETVDAVAKKCVSKPWFDFLEHPL